MLEERIINSEKKGGGGKFTWCMTEPHSEERNMTNEKYGD